MSGEITISLGNEQDTAQEFVATWQHAERGEVSDVPITHLYFLDLETLLQVLTPQRLSLLKTLHALGPVSIRTLAKAVERDHKQVHTDIDALEHLGLVARQKNRRLCVPWTRIVAELQLAA